MTPTHYERLQVAEDAQPGELYDAWQAELERVRAASEPGIAQAVALAEVNEAYRLLADRDRRAAYDRKLAAKRAESGDDDDEGFAETRMPDTAAGSLSRSLELDPGSLPDQRAPGQDSNWLTPPELQGDDLAADAAETAAADVARPARALEPAPQAAPITPAPNPAWMIERAGRTHTGSALWLRVAGAFVVGAAVGAWGWAHFGAPPPGLDGEFEAEAAAAAATPARTGTPADARMASGQVQHASGSGAASGAASGAVAQAGLPAVPAAAAASAASPQEQAHRAWLVVAASDDPHPMDGEGLSLGDAWVRSMALR